MFCKAPDPGVKQAILRSPRTALELAKHTVKSKTVNLKGKIQTLFRIIDTLEADLNRKQISPEGMENLQNGLGRIKPILSELLTIIEKEDAWQH
jgi:hypothetical protein